MWLVCVAFVVHVCVRLFPLVSVVAHCLLVSSWTFRERVRDAHHASTVRALCVHCACTVHAHSCSLCVHIRAVCACTLVQFVLMQWVHCLGSLCVILRNTDEYAYDLGRSGSECETLTVHCTVHCIVRAHSCSLCVHISAVCACTFVQFVCVHSCSFCAHIGAVYAATGIFEGVRFLAPCALKHNKNNCCAFRGLAHLKQYM